jgi:hypothetical protein
MQCIVGSQVAAKRAKWFSDRTRKLTSGREKRGILGENDGRYIEGPEPPPTAEKGSCLIERRDLRDVAPDRGRTDLTMTVPQCCGAALLLMLLLMRYPVDDGIDGHNARFRMSHIGTLANILIKSKRLHVFALFNDNVFHQAAGNSRLGAT